MPTENTPWKKLFVSEFLSTLKKECFNSHKFPAGTSISDKKYKHLRSKHMNSFYPFNNPLDQNLAYNFAESEITKGHMNKFLTNFLIAPLTKKLSYKNADK